MSDPPTGRPKRDGPGRPSRYTPETLAKINQALRSGATKTAAAAFAGISIDTFHAWERNFSDFIALVDSAEAAAEIVHTGIIMQAAQAGDWRASAWWLERRRHAEYGRRDRIELVNGVRKLAEAAGWNPDEVADAVRAAEELVRAK